MLASNSTDVSYHAVRAYYDIYEQTRREHPGLLFEICNDGGRMVDFRQRRARRLLLHHRYLRSALESARLLRHQLRAAGGDAGKLRGKMAGAALENFLYMLRSGMMGWLT